MYQTDKYQTYKYQTDKYKTDKYQTDKHQTDTYQTDKYQTDEHQTDICSSVKYQTVTHRYQTGAVSIRHQMHLCVRQRRVKCTRIRQWWALFLFNCLLPSFYSNRKRPRTYLNL